MRERGLVDAGDLHEPGRLPSEEQQDEPEPDVAEQVLAEMRGVVQRLRRQLHEYLYAAPEADDDDQDTSTAAGTRPPWPGS